MANKVVKHQITMSIAMLQCMLNNKWAKEDKTARELAAIKLVKLYLNEAEDVIIRQKK